MIYFYLKFLRAMRSPGYDFNVNVARFVLGMFVLYKLLSRDFGFYGIVPEHVFNFPPSDIYPAKSYKLWFGIPVISDFTTLHFIHWIIPYPTEVVLRIVQAVVMINLLIFSVYGPGYRRVFAISSFIGMLYLWGFMINGGHEVDAIALYFGMILTFCFNQYRNVPIYKIKRLWSSPVNVNAGLSQSMILVVLAAYYFMSGFNKLTDILLLNIFDSHLNVAIRQFHIREVFGYIDIPDVLYKLALFDISAFDYFGPIIVYASHLLAPAIIFKRVWIWKFALFYCLFHFIVFGVGISFFGYVIVWAVVLPWRNLFPFDKETKV